MMNKKKVTILVAGILALAFILGVTGALSLAGEPEMKKADRLVGFLVTNDFLSFMNLDSFVADHPGLFTHGGEIDLNGYRKEYGKIWATEAEKEMPRSDGSGTYTITGYDFPGVEGYCFISNSVREGSCITAHEPYRSPEICDYQHSVHTSDTEDILKFSTELCYVLREDRKSFFANPVYRTEDGRVYAVPAGSSYSFSREAPGSVTLTLSDSQYWSRGEESKKDTMEFVVEISIVDDTKSVSVMQFSRDNELLKADTFLPGTLPGELTPETGTEYIIVDTETDSPDKEYPHTHEVYTRGDETLSILELQENGYCVKRNCRILWD